MCKRSKAPTRCARLRRVYSEQRANTSLLRTGCSRGALNMAKILEKTYHKTLLNGDLRGIWNVLVFNLCVAIFLKGQGGQTWHNKLFLGIALYKGQPSAKLSDDHLVQAQLFPLILVTPL